jgi:hypothetical protein
MCGELARERRIAGVLRVHKRDAVLEVERVDDATLTLM